MTASCPGLVRAQARIMSGRDRRRRLQRPRRARDQRRKMLAIAAQVTRAMQSPSVASPSSTRASRTSHSRSTRDHAWTPAVERVYGRVPRNRGKLLIVTRALTYDRVEAAWAVETTAQPPEPSTPSSPTTSFQCVSLTTSLCWTIWAAPRQWHPRRYRGDGCTGAVHTCALSGPQSHQVLLVEAEDGNASARCSHRCDASSRHPLRC